MSAKDELTGAVLDHLLSGAGGEGLDRSLRALAGAIGVGHSLLLYHFGSRDGLLAAVHEECERRERAHLAAFGAEDADARTTMHRMWRHLAEPRMWPVYRLGFALRARRPAGADAVREPWIDELLPLVRAMGVPGAGARAEALLWLATCRGLLFELVTGADPLAVDAAAEAFFAHYSGAPQTR
ncbi:transcriptional regulator, TetR family [Actinacidiphila yanglinensis]|uniref:Transcriptional regulator, TetR family n=1 Tax=Actinacidiphila yanglinensis TaxID=310779 RepID=A0A1H6BZQ1_9ACTN|nr:TetR family transcriptional regulator [Actinacidiphila yanglinensis]SEG65616.1 transcriptional regulator, TetR family [Actinacidiphila yanglinensis]